MSAQAKAYPRAIVGGLVFNAENKFFLMRSSGKYGSQWIIPGGKIDFGESMLEALRRELREETGLELELIEFCGVRELLEPERHFVFLEFRARAKSPYKVTLNEEATEWGWFTHDDLAQISVAAPTLALIQEHGRPPAGGSR